jgi:hypothetical protein
VAGEASPRQPAHPQIYLGCAGWNLPRTAQDGFPAEGTHLARYAARLPAVEINSSFSRSHRPATYARWADNVPASFRFQSSFPSPSVLGAAVANCLDLLQKLETASR